MSAKPQRLMVERISRQHFDLMKRTNVKRRDRHEIVAQILETARSGLIKTHIMYKAKLSYAQLYEYLPLLVEKGFLETLLVQRSRKTIVVWKTTEQGIRFVENFRLLEL